MSNWLNKTEEKMKKKFQLDVEKTNYTAQKGSYLNRTWLEKAFSKGTRFELDGIVYVVTETDEHWIRYEREDGIEPHYSDTMAFMPMSDNWRNANIL